MSRLSSKTFKICRLNSIQHCSELKIYKKCGKSINGLIKAHQRFKSVLLSLGNVVHSDNDAESYACCCQGRQRCTESEIFDSAPASAEYTPTPTHFKVLDSDSCSNSKANYLNFWQCLNDRIRFSH